MRCLLPAVLFLALVVTQAAASTLTDDEPSNDLIGTATIQLVPTAAVTTGGGVFTLVHNDIDYVGIGNLAPGDVVTVSTTPLDDVHFEVPDTFIGLFTSGGSRVCENDDAINNELWVPASAGFGSLCRFVIDSPGTWYVGVTGAGEIPFNGSHFHSGQYELHVTINALEPPIASPTGTPSMTATASPTSSPTSTPPPPTPTSSPTATLTSSPTSSPTLFPTASPTSAPTATPTASPPLCMDPGASCSKNADCCSNLCSGQGQNKTCQAPPTPTYTPTATPTPTPTPEPDMMLQLLLGGLGLAWFQRRRNRCVKARNRS